MSYPRSGLGVREHYPGLNSVKTSGNKEVCLYLDLGLFIVFVLSVSFTDQLPTCRPTTLQWYNGSQP